MFLRDRFLARLWLVLRLQSPIRNGQLGCIRSAFLCHSSRACSSNSPSTQDSANEMIISNIVNCPVLGGINLMSPYIEQIGILFIVSNFVNSPVRGDLHETSASPHPFNDPSLPNEQRFPARLSQTTTSPSAKLEQLLRQPIVPGNGHNEESPEKLPAVVAVAAGDHIFRLRCPALTMLAVVPIPLHASCCAFARVLISPLAHNLLYSS